MRWAVGAPMERAYFQLCLALGQQLRASTYSVVHVAGVHGALEVRKHRRFYAPLLILLGEVLMRILNTGVRVLPQREWEAREKELYQALYGSVLRVKTGGRLVLPPLAGRTLAEVLDDPALDHSVRTKSIELAVLALAQFHAQGFTHGDAMAENVLIDSDGTVGRWFDFETIHDSRRSVEWRRADDLRALLSTCLLRTPDGKFVETCGLLLNAYKDEAVVQLVRSTFSSTLRRPLLFHLGQAPLSFRQFREIDRLLSARCGK